MLRLLPLLPLQRLLLLLRLLRQRLLLQGRQLHLPLHLHGSRVALTKMQLAPCHQGRLALSEGQHLALLGCESRLQAFLAPLRFSKLALLMLSSLQARPELLF